MDLCDRRREKLENLQDMGLDVMCALQVRGDCTNLELILSEIREILIDNQFTIEEHNTESGNALYFDCYKYWYQEYYLPFKKCYGSHCHNAEINVYCRLY